MNRTITVALGLLLAAAPGCSSESDASASGGATDGCTAAQIEVSYFGGAKDGDLDCATAPSECGGQPSCDEQACIAALYGLCESPWFGVGCSASGSRVIVSCNQ